jgi:hypothetical protein
VVFLPRALLEPSFDVMTDPDAAKGLAHMHALLGFARANGERETFALDEVVGATGATMTVFRSALGVGKVTSVG